MLIFCVFLSYLLGSIPFGIVVSKVKKINIKEIGSGNIGATNVTRALGVKYGALVCVLDGLKGLMPFILAKNILDNDVVFLVPLCAIIGHMFPIFLKFKGGKGVSTTIISYFGFDIFVTFAMILCWAMTFLFTRYSSLSAIVAIHIPLLLGIFGSNLGMMKFGIAVYFLVMYKHRENIVRLIKKSELKF